MTRSATERDSTRFGLTVVVMLLCVGVAIWAIITGLDADAKMELERGQAAATRFHKSQVTPPPAGHVPINDPAHDPRLPIVR